MISNPNNFPETLSLQKSPILLRRDQSPLREGIYDLNQGQNSEVNPDESLMDQTLLPSLDMEQQFDLIANKVNETIQSINSIYNEIGYSCQEIAEKKAEIFEAMNNTITSFKSNLQREKNSISNECEWLRQQIRIILAMLNDSSGEKHLKLSSRGIVFDNESMYTEGCKEDVLQHMSKLHLSRNMSNSFQFLDEDANGSPTGLLFSSTSGLGSPFSNGTTGEKTLNSQINADIISRDQYQYMLSHNPNLSLLQYKAKLNCIFLEVLKAFVKVFRKFNEVNRLFWENVETVFENGQTEHPCVLLNSIPTKQEAEEQYALIEDFDTIIDHLKLTNRNYKPELRQGLSDSTDDVAFIISSPRKNRQSLASPENETKPVSSTDENMDKLRDVNYKLVHAIRGLKITKITNEVVSQLTKEVETTEREIESRVAKMKAKIADCLKLIDALSLTELDLIAIQRMQNHSDREKQPSYAGEGLFDVDTLKFIERNPREFGLMDHHMNFVSKLTHTLQTIKDNKQKKWEQYSQACISLWEKLGENRSYTEQFLVDNSNLTDISLTNFKMELKRLYLKRAEYVDSFILDARNQISELQQKLLYSDARCKDFKYYDYDVNEHSGDKEEILNEHEAEIERLKNDYIAKESVLKLYSQLKELLEDQRFLAESSKDSSRLLSKNSCKILLNEEKLRKKINRNLPRVLASLKQEVVDFNHHLLSKGLLPVTAGNDDMFERILVIESEVASLLTNKYSRAKVGSPTKARSNTSTRSTSPKKTVVHSPSRVVKPGFQRRSPVIPESVNNSRRGILQRSALPRSRLSPTQTPRPGSSKNSPRGGELGLAKKSRLENTVLMPLNTSLAPGGLNTNGPSPVSRSESNSSTNSTLYSMCTRVSPLRNAPSGNVGITHPLLPAKRPGKILGALQNEDKENSLILEKVAAFGGPLVAKPPPGEPDHARLSGGSVANSTIVDDDYQTWRAERIRAINGEHTDG